MHSRLALLHSLPLLLAPARCQAQGYVSTVAGTGVTPYNGENGAAVNARLLGLQGLAFDGAGNFYIAGDGYRIRRVDPNGIIATVAGVNRLGLSGLAPGFVGLFQVNLQVPNNAPAGSEVALQLLTGNQFSNTATIAVQ